MKDLTIEENLELRLVNEKFAGEAFGLISRNYDYLHKWMPWVTRDYTEKSARDFFRHGSELIKKGHGLGYSIFLNDKLIGGIGFNKLDMMNRSAEIGYWLSEECQGGGIMTKSCRALTDYGFGDLGLNRIVIRCADANLNSRRIPERLGFTVEGTARQAELLHGKFLDLIIYVMLAEDWP